MMMKKCEARAPRTFQFQFSVVGFSRNQVKTG
jgi:hypothetical protein